MCELCKVKLVLRSPVCSDTRGDLLHRAAESRYPHFCLAGAFMQYKRAKTLDGELFLLRQVGIRGNHVLETGNQLAWPRHRLRLFDIAAQDNENTKANLLRIEQKSQSLEVSSPPAVFVLRGVSFGHYFGEPDAQFLTSSALRRSRKN